VTQDDIDHVVERIGDFGDDNRAGIARTLHRISAIRNRKGRIIGLTLRVGRAVYGTVEVIRDIVESGNSILLLGRPGVGKTTVLRETARILADQNRVVIVDTSNEIAGDGDIPHPAIGRARRMQVATPLLQHEVMIEAVENHNPQVIVIDEIGRELEALAARTIAERGVQLIGTAHGNSLDNLLMNPTLSDLIGGIESVTLSDEEARRRGTQKSVLERRAPPTFDVVIEIQTWQRLAIHHAVAAAVDAMLRGRPLTPELRSVSEGGEIVIEKPREADLGRPDGRAPGGGLGWRTGEPAAGFSAEPPGQAPGARIGPLKVFAYGVSQNRLRQSAKALGVPLSLSEDLTDAAALLTLKSYFRKRPVVISDAEARGIPIYVLRSNTTTQIENALVDLFGLTARADPADSAVRETREAIEQILTGSRAMVELSPQGPAIRRQQHELARQASLLSLSRGKEPHRRVRIFRHNGNNG
jgi:stage III sporulation protein SpoIIIAA